MATIVYLYALQNLFTPKIKWANRMMDILKYSDEVCLLKIIKNKLNLKAS